VADRHRLTGVDVARGAAVVAMVIYHASWFADDRGIIDIPIREALAWRAFQKSIAGSFFFLVGTSLYLANRRGIRPEAVVLRMGRVGGCALVVTLASLLLQPEWVVTFGILHNIALCSVVALAFLRLGWLNLVPGIIAVVLGVTVSHPWFDRPVLRWTGLGTEWWPTFDFQPFFPWFGVVILGIVAGQFALPVLPALSTLSRSELLRDALSWLGRHSLLMYMAHVPVLIVSVELIALIWGI